MLLKSVIITLKMGKSMKLLVSLFICACAFGQTQAVSNTSATGTVNNTSAAHTIPTQVGLGAAKPATCTAGELYFASDATAGSNLLGCTSGNTWTIVGPGGSATGTVTSITFSSPLSGGTITTSGTVGCATCTTSASSLTLNALVLGAGSQGMSVLGSLGTTVTVLHGNASGAPSFGAVNLATDTTGVNPIGSGGTGTGSTLTGLVRGSSSAMTASELSGDCATSGSNVVSCTKINGAAWPTGSQGQFLSLTLNSGNTTALNLLTPFELNPLWGFSFSAITPTGSPSLSVGAQDVEVPLAPQGIDTSTGHYYWYISGGTGTAEAAAIAAPASHSPTCTPGLANCYVKVTAANTHSGAYTFTPASGGVQETVNWGCTNTSAPEIYIPQAQFDIYAPAIYVPCGVQFIGSNNFSLLNVHSTTGGALDIAASGTHVSGLTIQTAGGVTQTSGGYAIRLGQSSEVNNCVIENNYISGAFYDAELNVKSNRIHSRNNFIIGFLHTGITFGDSANTDTAASVESIGDQIQTGSLGSPALACIAISTGGGYILGGSCYSSDSTSLTNGVYGSWAANSSGLAISGGYYPQNVLQGISLTTTGGAVFQNVTIGDVNIVLVNSASAIGVELSGSVQTGTIHGVTILGANTGQGVNAFGSNDNWTWDGNTLKGLSVGYLPNTNSSQHITLGSSNMPSVTTPVTDGTTSHTVNLVAPMTYSQLQAWANGSYVYITDGTVGSSCSGGGTGAFAKRVNGAWVCN